MNKNQLLMKAFYLALFIFFSFHSYAQVTQQWVARYDGPKVTQDVVHDITHDTGGNIYVTGSSSTGDLSSSIVTAKYDEAGELLWSKMKTFEGTSSSRGVAIVTDGYGNVYVAGVTSNEMEDYYVTIKYDKDGNELWAAKYIEPTDENENGSGRASAITIDNGGNVYVTGNTVTIKYDANGNELWVNTNVSGNKIVIDESNNVYVAGLNITKLTDAGNLLWTASYGGEGAVDLALDENNNVYVTGNSGTIKYNWSGQKLWTKTSPNLDVAALALDPWNNVYITGTVEGSTSGKNFRTVKYSTDGKWLWSQLFNGVANLDDIANDIDVDAQGNVYVTGKSQTSELTQVTANAQLVTIKYAMDGNKLWVKNMATSNDAFLEANLPFIELTNNDNVYVAGTKDVSAINSDIFLVNYSKGGQQNWVAYFNGPGTAFDVVTDMTTDAAGNVYVTGYTWSFGLDQEHADFATVKYDALGKELWARTFTGTEADVYSNNDEANAIAVDESGNVYVTGLSTKIIHNNDGSTTNVEYITTIKFDADGNLLWTKFYGAGVGNDITVDHNGNIYITGYSLTIDQSTGQTTTGGMVTVKYDAEGNQLWSQTITESQISFTGGQVIATDAAGNVYVSGNLHSEGNELVLTTIAYNTNGTQLWMQQQNNLYFWDMEVDAEGHTYVSGYNNDAAQVITVKYNIDGTENWTNTYSAMAAAYYRQQPLAIDKMGQVYIAFSEEEKIQLIKLNADGSLAWNKSVDAHPDGIDYARDLKVDNASNIYLVSNSITNNAEETQYFVTLKLDVNGNTLWSENYQYHSHFESEIILALDSFNNVIISGTADEDYVTIKYAQSQTEVPPLVVDAGKDKTLYRGYGSQCKTIYASVSGGTAPYTYLWTNDNSTSSEARVCPTTTTTYTLTVTDANGNQASDEVTINVMDVRCGNNNDKVIVCHKGKMLCIGKDAVEDHLKHGDQLGMCSIDAGITQAQQNISTEALTTNIFKASNTPNPFVTSTNIQYIIPYDGIVQINVYDVLGREVRRLVDGQQKVGSYTTLFTAKEKGIYYYRITLTSNNKTVTQSGKMIRN